MNIYEEIEVPVISAGKIIKYSFPKSVIQYYREYTDSPLEGKGGIKTMLYLQGSVKGLILDCGYSTLKKKLNSLDLSKLSNDELNQVISLIDSFKKNTPTEVEV